MGRPGGLYQFWFTYYENRCFSFILSLFLLLIFCTENGSQEDEWSISTKIIEAPSPKEYGTGRIWGAQWSKTNPWCYDMLCLMYGFRIWMAVMYRLSQAGNYSEDHANWRTGELANSRSELANWRTGELANWRTGEWVKFGEGEKCSQNLATLSLYIALTDFLIDLPWSNGLIFIPNAAD